MNNPLDKLLTEWAYRVHDGMPNPKDNYHVVQLEQYLNELRLPRRVVKKVLEKVRTYAKNAENDRLGRTGKPWGSAAKDVSDRGVSDDDVDQRTDDELASMQKSDLEGMEGGEPAKATDSFDRQLHQSKLNAEKTQKLVDKRKAEILEQTRSCPFVFYFKDFIF